MATMQHVPFNTCIFHGTFIYIHADGLHHVCETRILFHHFQGLKPYTIARVLDDEGVKVSRFGVHKLIQHYNELGSIDKKGG
jgi:hemerythrin-like domain-containing protein